GCMYETRRLHSRPEGVDLASALPALAQSFQVLPGGDRLSMEVSESICALVDPRRLEQMVGNLLVNALRYAPTGPIVVRARTYGSCEVCIEVSDQGPGIPIELQSRVWERFFRLPGSEALTKGSP